MTWRGAPAHVIFRFAHLRGGNKVGNFAASVNCAKTEFLRKDTPVGILCIFSQKLGFLLKDARMYLSFSPPRAAPLAAVRVLPSGKRRVCGGLAGAVALALPVRARAPPLRWLRVGASSPRRLAASTPRRASRGCAGSAVWRASPRSGASLRVSAQATCLRLRSPALLCRLLRLWRVLPSGGAICLAPLRSRRSRLFGRFAPR